MISYELDFIKYFVKYNAPNKLFDNPEEREHWDSEQIARWFNSFWENGFRECILESDPIPSDAAYDQLELKKKDDARRKFFKHDMQHRLVRYEDVTFIVQLKIDSNLQVNQVWFVRSKDYDPLRICVKFPSMASKKRFLSLSDSSDKYGNRLLERIVRDYMAERDQAWD